MRGLGDGAVVGGAGDGGRDVGLLLLLGGGVAVDRLGGRGGLGGRGRVLLILLVCVVCGRGGIGWWVGLLL